MSVVVNTNTQSIFAQRALGMNTSKLQGNIEKLSTGFRINRAADDAAGLSISEKLTARINGFEKAKQNASDGISMVQTAEGSLGIIQDNMQRIRELVVQGLNGTNSVNEINAIQNEINERIRIIADIGTETEFNGISLLDPNNASFGDRILQTGADAGQTTTIGFAVGSTTPSTGVGIDVDYQFTNADADHGHMIENVRTTAFNGGNGFALSELQLAGATVDSLAVAEARTMTGTGTAVNVQIEINNPPGTAGNINLDDLDVMIDNISRMRSELGATQNALDSKITYLDTAMENAAASRSRIKDVDVAKESSALVKNQILQQSAAAMLSQANSQPQIALQLIGG